MLAYKWRAYSGSKSTHTEWLMGEVGLSARRNHTEMVPTQGQLFRRNAAGYSNVTPHDKPDLRIAELNGRVVLGIKRDLG
jgi:hypothetical protein